jgi:peptidoglycan/LPS O-acetylase OafA/YrhL
LTIHFVGLFAIGMGAAWLAADGSARRVPWNALALGLAATTLLAGVAAHRSLDALAPFLELPLALTVACLLVGASQPARSRGVHAVLGSRSLAFVGTFSYSLYLIHAPLLQAFWQYALRPHHLGAARDAAVLGLVGVPLVLVAAYGFFIVVERPFIRRRSIGSGEDPGGAIAGSASSVNNALAPVANPG